MGPSTTLGTYTPLPAGCIRLLTIHPRQDAELITCTLRVEKLDTKSRPSYEALSYVWGTPKQRFPILLDGHPHLVQINLLNFLIHQCQHDAIWVDALCINQEDIAERNTQVQMMGDIYRNAERVLVRLGLALDDSLARLMNANGASSASYSERGGQTYRALEALPYWNRVWTVQEFISARDIQLVYGDVRTDLRALNRKLGHSSSEGHRTRQPSSNMLSLWLQRVSPKEATLIGIIRYFEKAMTDRLDSEAQGRTHVDLEDFTQWVRITSNAPLLDFTNLFTPIHDIKENGDTQWPDALSHASCHIIAGSSTAVRPTIHCGFAIACGDVAEHDLLLSFKHWESALFVGREQSLRGPNSFEPDVKLTASLPHYHSIAPFTTDSHLQLWHPSLDDQFDMDLTSQDILSLIGWSKGICEPTNVSLSRKGRW